METLGKTVYGLGEISKEAGNMDERTIRRLVKKDNFPARKIGGRWVSNTDLITRWWKRRVAEGPSD